MNSNLLEVYQYIVHSPRSKTQHHKALYINKHSIKIPLNYLGDFNFQPILLLSLLKHSPKFCAQISS